MGLGIGTGSTSRRGRTMVKSKYRREQKAKDDNKQARLDFQSPTLIKVKPTIKTEITQTHVGEYMCPFCLHKDRINLYLISTKKGYDKRLGQCPECHKKMNIDTLTKKMTPEQFAEFAFGYSSSGYWQKVNFKVFNFRLEKMGWAQKFWTKYRELKGDSTQENYADYVQRVQEEEAKEKGWIPQ